MSSSYHIPVLLSEVLDSLPWRASAIYCDATLGDGGYALGILQRAPKGCRVYGIDQDEQALTRACERLAGFGDSFVAVHGNFRNIKQLLNERGVQAVDGIVCDLGVSKLHLTDAGRGFMFSENGPLDMRMSQELKLNAAEVVNRFGEQELADIFYQYGEERQARRIAAAVVRARAKKPFETTGKLADIVRRVVGGQHVVKSLARIFQSLRIFVNDELAALRDFLPQVLDLLCDGGRLAVVEYHSLEARIVKDFMHHESNPCTCPKDLPQCVCGKTPRLRIVARQVKPGAAEVAANPSARSARLRVVEKIGD